MEYKNKTTIAYSDDENELTVLVNEKPVNKYVFKLYADDTDFENMHPCALCVLKTIHRNWCEIKCVSDERKDGRSGYFICN